MMAGVFHFMLILLNCIVVHRKQRRRPINPEPWWSAGLDRRPIRIRSSSALLFILWQFNMLERSDHPAQGAKSRAGRASVSSPFKLQSPDKPPLPISIVALLAI
jgi:hypothetical protein